MGIYMKLTKYLLSNLSDEIIVTILVTNNIKCTKIPAN